MSKGGQQKKSDYEVTYFAARGRGEFARLILGVNGVDFKDNRIEFANWEAFKAKTPLGSMPVLKIDDMEIPETFAIIRILGRELGMYGKTTVIQRKVDVLLEMIREVVDKAIPLAFGAKENAVKFQKEDVSIYFKRLEKMINTLEPKGAFATGDEMNIADLTLFHGIALVDGENQIAKFDTLKAICEKVASVPKVKEYLEKRKDESSCIFKLGS